MADECSSRVKQSKAASFKAQCNSEKGKHDIRAFLDGLLKLQEPFDGHKKEWSLYLLAGGKTPEEFKNTVKSYDSPTICGLVWNRNFVAYRCRDCGISPCMSICADCFHAGNHEGHDFNMFKSQAGGACDCGDESVMSKDGFCSRHGTKDGDLPSRKPPTDLFAMTRIVLPRLCMRLHYQLEQVDEESLGTSSPLMEDTNELSDFLVSICETDTMKNVMAECLMTRMCDNESQLKHRPLTVSTRSGSFILRSVASKYKTKQLPREDSLSSIASTSSCDILDEDHRTYLDFMMNFVTKYEFPQRLVTFLLHLLPCKEYKESFTKVFCQHYQMIARALVSSDGPSVEQLSNRVVHVSVQLFSNRDLAEKMVAEQNLLHVMVKVLHDMVRPSLKEVKGGDQLLSYQLVVNCDNRALSHHCYWPIVSDFINILSHKSVAEIFMKNHDLIKQWMTFIQYLTGMNISHRQVSSHIEFEPTVYYTSFSVELEAASSPLWSFINGCKVLNNSVCVRNMIIGSIEALRKWYKHVDSMPKHGEVTFHLPLHRHIAGFLSVATSHFNIPLQGIIPNQDLLRQMVEHLLQIQAAMCEIRAGRWVRNGGQIRSQVRLYVECHFCNSMIDLDMFMLQVCATFLDPDCFLDAVLERYGIQHWFQFGDLSVPTPPCFDADTDAAMVEGALNLIITLLSSRLHLGMSHQEIIRQEMVAQLCMADRTHSQLVDLIPDKPGQSHKMQDFEAVLSELADYKAPGFESGWMQQGMYTPKDQVWEREFDPTHMVYRAVQRQDIQSGMSRYAAYMNKCGKSSATSSLWPPFHALKPLPRSFEGLLRLLHCKTMHGMLFYIFHRASLDSTAIPDGVLYMAVHLTSLALDTKIPPPSVGFKPSVMKLQQSDDVGYQIVSRCIDYLDEYGKEVKGLHQIEDLRCINGELMTRLHQDPFAPMSPQQDSCHDVCVVMVYALHHVMHPPLFNSFLPFMSEVLNSALNNQSNTQEKVAQLQHIQYMLELLPVHRQRLVHKLTRHLVSVSERYNIPTKNLVLVSDDTQPLELSMLLMYLVKYHDWLFRVHSPPRGWPRSLVHLDFPSSIMVQNIRHKIGIVSQQRAEPMDTSEPQTSPDGPSISQGSSAAQSGTILVRQHSGSDTEEPTDFQKLVQEFIAVTEAPESVARTLLRTCRGDLAIAINMHLNMEETLPRIEQQGSVVAKPASVPMGSSVPGGPDIIKPSTSQRQENAIPVALNESILSLLVKLKTTMQESVSNASPSSSGSGLYYVNKLLEQISQSSPDNAQALASHLPSPEEGNSKVQSPGTETDDPAARNALRRQRARERQQKLLAEFASKQKSFLEKTMKMSQDSSDMEMEVDAGSSAVEVEAQTFECVICGESSPSTEERPVGLVALLQPSAVLRHRTKRQQSRIPCSADSDLVYGHNCGTAEKLRMDALSKYFCKEASMRASSVGADGGIHIQTCCHYIHVDCQQSYLRSLQAEEAVQLHQMHSFNSRNGEFTCPLCRQLGNCLLPEIPARIMPVKNSQAKTKLSHIECLNGLSERVKKYRQKCMSKLTASALNFSVLGASVKSVVEIALMLESGESQNWPSERKFALLYQTIRTNLELEQVDKIARQLSTPRRSCLGSLVRAFQLHSQTLVAPLLNVWSQITGGERTQDKNPSPFQDSPLLLRDCTSLLIQFILAWPAPFTHRDFQCVVQLIYNVAFTQALVEACCKFVGDERLSWQETGKRALAQEKLEKPLTIDMLLGFVTQSLASSKLFKDDNTMLGISQTVWSPHTVEQSIRDSCLPFLKLACLMSSLCYDTQLPAQSDDQEFYSLALCLGLCPTDSSPTPDTVSCASCLRWPHDKPLSIIRQWCDELAAVTKRCDRLTRPQDLLPSMQQWPAPQLLQLPDRYDSLIQHYRKQTCPKCQQRPDDPAICLVCGRFTCLQGTCCMSGEETRKFECVQHASECGAGTGVFLIVLSSVIIIIRADRVCIWGSVYLDSFGEEDRDLRRGKPLFLSKDRFRRLQEQWFTHSFDHTCKRWKRHLNTL